MARGDILLAIVRTALNGDMVSFRKSLEVLIQEEREKKHHILADKLVASLSNSTSNNKLNGSHIRPNDNTKDLIFESTPHRNLDSLYLEDHVRDTVKELIEEQHRAELLRSYGIEPRHRILLAGSPGNGKTTLAEAISYELMCPMYTVRYENLIGSFLGETSNRLMKVFDFIKTQRCVLFFDEFDAIGKERGDTKETGEIKRVVSSLLLQMDQLPSYVVVVTASNHPELLDRAVWRRFQLKLELTKPSKALIEKQIESAISKSSINLNYNLKNLSSKLEGLSFAEVEEFYLDVFRQSILKRKQDNAKSIVTNSLKQWSNKFIAK
ncbi:ATP-binding protein [Marinifilum fragile]|uniref:AAA family ATPase n=1 Tax=Marinifilum fragile TaxID=570161 RepID=UPI002AA6E279|nr:ATP-binding protein [Marinifilum fragile]